MRITKTRFIFIVAALLLTAAELSFGQFSITTVAGGGPTNLTALGSSIGYVGSVVMDGSGNTYIADSYSSHVFKVSSGTLTILAGNGTYGYSGDGGPAASALVGECYGIALDTAGNVYFTDK
jgi:hypothetical protein